MPPVNDENILWRGNHSFTKRCSLRIQWKREENSEDWYERAIRSTRVEGTGTKGVEVWIAGWRELGDAWVVLEVWRHSIDLLFWSKYVCTHMRCGYQSVGGFRLTLEALEYYNYDRFRKYKTVYRYIDSTVFSLTMLCEQVYYTNLNNK